MPRRPRAAPPAPAMLALTVLVLLLAFAALAVEVETHGWFVAYGHYLSRAVARRRGDVLVAVMRVITAFGNGFVLAGVTVLAGAAFAYLRRNCAPLVLLACALAGAKAAETIVKAITARARPRAPIAVYTEHSYAFPSGHTTATTALCVALAVLVASAVRHWWAQLAAYAMAVLASATMGVSRVVLGVHWPTDVVGGWLLGTAWALLCVTAGHVACLRQGERFPPRLWPHVQSRRRR